MTSRSKKSASNLHKHISKGSVISVRKDLSSSSARDHKSSSHLNENFSMTFQEYCKQYHTETMPEVFVIPCEFYPGSFTEMIQGYHREIIGSKEHSNASRNAQTIAIVYVILDHYDPQTVLNTVILRQFPVDRSMLTALRKSFQKFDTVGTLKLEFCGLTNTDLRVLKMILVKNKVITDLSIDGNPNKFQNFYILLKNTKLIHLSMCHCQINDRGVHLIQKQLTNFQDQSLTSLGLASNYISAEGAGHVADFLRSNRTLISLNLADNWLTDDGLIKLTNVFKKFSLIHDEIVDRRHRIISSLHKKAKQAEPQNETTSQSLDTDSLKNKNKKQNKDCDRRSGRTSFSSTTRKDSVSPIKSMEHTLQSVDEVDESDIDFDPHPFVIDSYPEDGEIYCKGNLKVVHLNLACKNNKITVLGLRQIIDMLKYQKMMVSHSEEGLSYITLDGNDFPDSSQELISIQEQLKESFLRRSLIIPFENRRDSKRRKSTLSRVASANL